MKLSDGEKLILVMLADLYKHLEVNGDIDADFVSEAITSGHTWALPVRYTGVFHDEDTSPHVVQKVHDVLSMWSWIEHSVEQLDDADRERVTTEAAPFGKNPSWPGFDGNNESAYMSAASFMVDHMNMYPEFKGRNKNSHHPTLETAGRMKPLFDRLTEGHFGTTLSADDLIRLLKEQVHPENRKPA